ncbi:MAG: two-component system response regulator [Deltaproteobacteria bacterium]|nr:MAG: two-component system response regulator [Deltaproteobacteria bacterium]
MSSTPSIYQQLLKSTPYIIPQGRILVVDDEEHIRTLLKDALEELGYECDTAENGLRGLEKVEENKGKYEAILLDIHMPELNGIETLKRLKLSYPDISVVVLSASRDVENVRDALKEGAYDYVFKPFDLNELKNTIKRACERTKLIRENRDYQKNLEIKVAEQTETLINLYADTLEALVLALDLREHETGFHSYRVTEYSLTLARKLGLPDKALSILAKGALLHDIGKIGIPDSILLKPGKLTDEEWKIMKMHPTMGYELLKKIDFLEEAAEIVLSHHEHYNGKGYPRGLKGEQIPLGARIFSVVDALDAMTSNRPYRQALSFEEAIERIAKSSGSQFDPSIVRVFLSIPKEEWMEIRNRIEKAEEPYLKKLLHNLSKP